MSSPQEGEIASGISSASGRDSTSVYPLSLWRVRRFIPALRRISSELKLPEPMKSRILLEMASDLEALYDHYRTRGCEEDEAARLAEEKILSSPEALHQLIVVHTTGYQRWAARAAGGLQWSFELLLFAAGVVPILVVAFLVVVKRAEGLLSQLLSWPLLLVGAAIVGISLWKAYQIFLGRVRSTADLHRGLFTLLFLGAVGPALGGLVFLVNLYGIAMGMMVSDPSPAALLETAERVAQDATLFGMGLLLGIGAGLVWFVLVNRIAVIEQAESAAFLAE